MQESHHLRLALLDGVVLSEEPSSRTFILDQRRVKSETTAIETAFWQLAQIAPQLPKRSIVLLDRGYDSTWLWCRCSTLPIGVLGRLEQKRCFYRPAPPPTGKRGSPRKDGDLLQVGNAATYGTPDGQFAGEDAKGRPVQISWWKHLHVKEARWLEVTVIRVIRSHATNSERDPKISWFVWLGDTEADLAQHGLCPAFWTRAWLSL